MADNFKLLGNRVMMLQEEAEEISKIILLPQDQMRKPNRGKVVAAGPGRHRSSGEVVPIGVDAGDTIIYTKGDYQKYTYHDQEHLIINGHNIIARTNEAIQSTHAKEHIACLFEDTAFYNKERKELEFNWKAMRDVVFVVPDPLPEKYRVPGEQLEPILFIPDRFREKHGNEYGIVISVGPGYYDRHMRFKPTDVQIGDRVIYDKEVPWSLDLKGADGKDHVCKFMGNGDIKAIVPRE